MSERVCVGGRVGECVSVCVWVCVCLVCVCLSVCLCACVCESVSVRQCHVCVCDCVSVCVYSFMNGTTLRAHACGFVSLHTARAGSQSPPTANNQSGHC